ncbi:hypothetical protein Ccrd_002496 [Cynara cardunculus var. scolymus]|uniref:Uncharacterized protein n=1 Tax=Cynara cardunculus var. scolymus TaxID=59895 RepID=A0A124SD04_CYNCS|nr:hypothetical protein Ccrd_002496 [Cynara cardunculus var. scolymus]
MCTFTPSKCNTSLLSVTPKPKSKPKRIRIQLSRLHRLSRTKRATDNDEKSKQEMELKNLKLYMENMSILKDNEILRKKAIQLHQENLCLLLELQKKLSPLHHVQQSEIS